MHHAISITNITWNTDVVCFMIVLLKYLSLTLCHTQSCLASLDATRNIALAFRMYDVCVRTVQTYGSAVWATGSYSSDPVTVIRGVLEAGHLHEAMVPLEGKCSSVGYLC